jgi:hypothetical protein
MIHTYNPYISIMHIHTLHISIHKHTYENARYQNKGNLQNQSFDPLTEGANSKIL